MVSSGTIRARLNGTSAPEETAPFLWEGITELKPLPRAKGAKPSHAAPQSSAPSHDETERLRIEAWRKVQTGKLWLEVLRVSLRFVLFLVLIVKGAPIVVSLAHHVMGEPGSITVDANEKGSNP